MKVAKTLPDQSTASRGGAGGETTRPILDQRLTSTSRIIIPLPSPRLRDQLVLPPLPFAGDPIELIPAPPEAALSSHFISLPPSSSSSEFSEQEQNRKEREREREREMGGRAMKDYLGRIARFGPMILNYAVAMGGETSEPVRAFYTTSTNTTFSSSDNDEDDDEKVEEGDPTIAKEEVSSLETGEQAKGARGFSLVDLQRLVLSSTRHWWRSTRENNLIGPPATGTNGSDGAGLDVDLSGLFGQSGITPDQSGGGGEEEGLFLNYYSAKDLIGLLQDTGVIDELDRKGYRDISLIFDTEDPYQHRLSLVDESLFGPRGRQLSSSERFLIDLYMKRRREWKLEGMVSYQLMNRLVLAGTWEELRNLTGEVRAPFVGIEGAREVIKFFETEVPRCSKGAKKGTGIWDVTEIAWLNMHDPLKAPTRPSLPGQRFPGLGLSNQINTVMTLMASTSLITDALLNFPFHFHQARAYDRRGYRFVDPIMQAYTVWMENQLSLVGTEHGAGFVAWGVSMGFCRRITEEFLPSSDSESETSGEWRTISSRLERWSPSEQLFPTSTSITLFLSSPAYMKLYDKYLALFNLDGGANLEGVAMVPVSPTTREGEGRRRRARLVIDLEGCPELWKYSIIWSKRDPETGEFH